MNCILKVRYHIFAKWFILVTCTILNMVCWSRNSNTLATWCEEPTYRKTLWEDWGQEEKGVTEDEMVVWHRWLSAHKFEQTLGYSEGQGNLACFRPCGYKESDITEWLNSNNIYDSVFISESKFETSNSSYQIQEQTLYVPILRVSASLNFAPYMPYSPHPSPNPIVQG